MSLRMRPMTGEELTRSIDAWRDAFATARIQSGEAEAIARQAAAEQHAAYFPDGRPAPRHEIMILEIDGERIGFLWVGPHPRRPNASEAAWLYNIEIDEDRRGQGFGRAGIALVEAHLALAGVTELGLNVFGGNDIARRLYATAGYDEIAVTMANRLAPES